MMVENVVVVIVNKKTAVVCRLDLLSGRHDTFSEVWSLFLSPSARSWGQGRNKDY